MSSSNLEGAARTSLLLWIVSTVILMCSASCHRGSQTQTAETSTTVAEGGTASSAPVEQFCRGCHVAPLASSFPREAWPDEVERGYDFFYQSTRFDLDPPPLQVAIDYYMSKAPEQLAAVAGPRAPFTGVKTVQVEVPSEPPLQSAAHVRWLGQDGPLAGLWLCDMASGVLWHGSPETSPTEMRWQRAASVANPCRIEPCNLDGKGGGQLVVADLGSFLPEDHAKGAVWWLRRETDAEERWSCLPLQTGMARVSDVRPLDVDGDGDEDLIVAEFGWQKTGRVTLLTNQGAGEDGILQFESRVIDERHGAIHVPVVDLNGDGHLDFVALFAQEHEVIEAFLNDGQGGFAKTTLYQADDPAFGSSGIDLVDFDDDGDVDILYTNGDSFDSALAKPYHGVRWLENRGELQFEAHEIGRLPGVHCARVVDFDGDGDKDVVAWALLPEPVLEASPELFDGVVLFVQEAPNEFTGRSLLAGDCRFASGDVVDVDRDGRVECVTARFQWEPTSSGQVIWFRPTTAN